MTSVLDSTQNTCQTTNPDDLVSLSLLSLVQPDHRTFRETCSKAQERMLEDDDEYVSQTLRSPPSFAQTPAKEGSSPGSSELPSMPSEKSNSRGCSGEGSSNCYPLSEVTDGERSASEGSMSPINQQNNEIARIPFSPHSRSEDVGRLCSGTSVSQMDCKRVMPLPISSTPSHFAASQSCAYPPPIEQRGIAFPQSSYCPSSTQMQYIHTYNQPSYRTDATMCRPAPNELNNPYTVSSCQAWPTSNEFSRQSHPANSVHPQSPNRFPHGFRAPSGITYRRPKPVQLEDTFPSLPNQSHSWRPAWPMQSSTPVLSASMERDYSPHTYPSTLAESQSMSWRRMAMNNSRDIPNNCDRTNSVVHPRPFSDSVDPSYFPNPHLTAACGNPITYTTNPSVRNCSPISYQKAPWDANNVYSSYGAPGSVRHPPPPSKMSDNPNSRSFPIPTNRTNGESVHPISRTLGYRDVSSHPDPHSQINGHPEQLKRRSIPGSHPRAPKRRRVSDKKLNLNRSVCPSSISNDLHLELLDTRPSPHNPVISLLPNIHPPVPTPICQRTCDKLLQNVQSTPTRSLDTISRFGKYSRFPLSLSPPKVSPFDDNTLHCALVKHASEQCSTSRVMQDNLLVSSLRRASVRCNQSYAYPLPPSPVYNPETTCTLLDQLEVEKNSDGQTTPPLSPKHRPIRKARAVHCTPEHLPVPRPFGGEEVISSELLTFNTSVSCARCSMQILEPGTAIKWTSPDGETRLYFCSTTCSNVYQLSSIHTDCKLNMSGMYNCPGFSVALLLSDSIAPSTVLLRQSNVRLNKHNNKRPVLADTSGRRKHTVDAFPLVRSGNNRGTIHGWNHLKWRRFSRATQTDKRRLIAAHPTFRTLFDSPCHAPVTRLARQTTLSSRSADSNKDGRVCLLCQKSGDAAGAIAGRLLQYDFDMWLHLNCVLWCYDTCETVSGSLVNVSCALKKAMRTNCTECHTIGAALPCFEPECQAIYHLPCAYAIGCSFHTDRGMYCPMHASTEHQYPCLDSLAVERRVFICRDENTQVSNVILNVDQHTEPQLHRPPGINNSVKVRVGGLTLHNVGQLLPEQISSGRFHSTNFIYPVGYWSTRIYWSYRHARKRCFYHCKITDDMCDSASSSVKNPSIRFLVEVEEFGEASEVFEHATCDGVWQQVLTRINRTRRTRSNFIRVVQNHLTGEYLFGLNEPHVTRAIESLPGTDRLNNYQFKFGRLQLIREMPLAINPTGCARLEPKLRTHVRRKSLTDTSSQHVALVRNITGPHQIPTSVRTNLASPVYSPSSSFVGISKLQQYKRLRSEWRFNVVLARSRIQGLGLYAARDLSKYTFIIEYLGELIRNEVGNRRELRYERQNRGVYMFRVNDDSIVDATMCGGLARYINHSCEPNCNAEIVSCDNGNHIIILANRDVEKGEELTYDYKFDFEEDRGDRIPCLCGAANCRQWMN